MAKPGMMMNDNDPNESKSSGSSLNPHKGERDELDDDLKGIPSFILDLQQTQPTLNIMTCGDVSHGKSTLLAALSGEKTGKYSAEIRNNMTIRLGYTSCKIWKCLLCPRPQCYFSTHSDTKIKKIKCKHCDSTPKNGAVILIRHLSFVDVPGHAHLMQTMVSAACVSDAAILVIDASSKLCPGKQTEQHCSAINLLGLMKEKQIIVAQNKIDITDHSAACLNYERIRNYLSTFSTKLAYNTPVIPISAQSKLNIDALCGSIVHDLPSYSSKLNNKVNLTTNGLRMNIIRSFDVNRAKDLATDHDIDTIAGGIIGGAVLNGHIKVGQLIEIRPGYIKKKRLKKYKDKIVNKLQPQWEAQPIITRVISLKYGKNGATVAYPGGNVGVQTNVDPSLTKSDRMCGHIVIDADNNNPPPIFNKFVMSYVFLSDHEERQKEFKILEPIRVNIGSMKMKAEIVKKNIGDFNGVLVVLEAPICANIGDPVGICRSGKQKEWSFVGGGIIRKTKNIKIVSDEEREIKQQTIEPDHDHDNDNKLNLEQLKKCDNTNLVKVLTKYLNHNDHARLKQHQNKIISYFIEHKVNGQMMAHINGKEFIKKIGEHLQEKKKLNGAIFQLYKTIRIHQYDQVKSSKSKPKATSKVSQSPKKGLKSREPSKNAMIFENGKNEIVGIDKNKNKVHLYYQQRTGRKGMTTIVGLPQNLNFSKLLKKMKKKWSSGGTILKDDADEIGPVIKLNGDFRDKVKAFLVEQYIVDKDQITKHGY
eukprot:432291_1